MAQSIKITRRGLAALRRKSMKIFQSNNEQEEYEEKPKLRDIFKSQEDEENARQRKA